MHQLRAYGGAHVPLPGLEAVGEPLMSVTRVASATSDPQLPSQPQGITANIGWYQIILFGDGGTLYVAQGCTRQRVGWDSNPQPLDRKYGTPPL